MRGPFCNFDPNDNGTQAGLNPALIQQGDVTVETHCYGDSEFTRLGPRATRLWFCSGMKTTTASLRSPTV